MAIPLTEFQRVVAKVYGQGDYEWLLGEPNYWDNPPTMEIGDGLFRFIWRELSSSEGCDDMDTAINRMERAVTDVQVVIDGLIKAKG